MFNFILEVFKNFRYFYSNFWIFGILIIVVIFLFIIMFFLEDKFEFLIDLFF